MLTRLPHRITIQSETRTNFEGGAYTTSWTTDSTVWGNVQVDSLGETYDQDKKQQMAFYKVVVRAETDITNKKRILFDSNILNVETVGDPTNRSRLKAVKCRLENT